MYYLRLNKFQEYWLKKNISFDDAFEKFISSKTYNILQRAKKVDNAYQELG